MVVFVFPKPTQGGPGASCTSLQGMVARKSLPQNAPHDSKMFNQTLL